MNKIILMGRLTRDSEIRYSQGSNPMAVARYTLAVDKKKKRDDGIIADFFRIVAFDRLAEFAERYLHKGTKILLSGHVQTGTYEKDGVKMPFFEVVAGEQEFAESKGAGGSNDRNGRNSMDSDGFGVVEIILALAVMIVLVMIFGDDISRFIADMIMRLS